MTEPAGMQALHPAAQHLQTFCAGQASWTVLDTGFGQGQSFSHIRHCWWGQPARPRMLHYVGVLSAEDARGLQTVLLQASRERAAGHEHTQELAHQCFGLGPGFHRILLDQGALSLTLCVGDVGTMLAQQDMQADAILADALQGPWDKWQLKTLARHCRRGTSLHFQVAALPDTALLEAAGFVLQEPSDRSVAVAVFQPRWTLRHSRRGQRDSLRAPGVCAVVGAGIAGASVARALAIRGWEVQVLDAQPHPAAGASGLPLGLVVPHHSADDSPRSRMSRAGTRLTLQHAAHLRIGLDWNPSGVLELQPDAPGLDDVEVEVRSPSRGMAETGDWAQARAFDGMAGLWHPHAAWLRPARLVDYWLGHPGIRFQGNTQVTHLERSAGRWRLHDAHGNAVAQADTVVFANAFACLELLQHMDRELAGSIPWASDLWAKLRGLQVLHGTLSMGPVPGGHLPGWPGFPVNGHGSFVGGVPTGDGAAWFAGSTFRSGADALQDLACEQATNFTKLQALLPRVAQSLHPQFVQGQVQHWQSSRCVSHDRLPLVGPLEETDAPTLWMSAGMGARGLSFSALAAELIAAWMGGEPLPLEASLARGLSTQRPRRQRTAPASKAQGALDSRQV